MGIFKSLVAVFSTEAQVMRTLNRLHVSDGVMEDFDKFYAETKAGQEASQCTTTPPRPASR